MKRSRSTEANHASDLQVGGQRVAALRVLPGVPATRGDCPVSRPCGHVRCEWNLWMVDGRDRPGRRWEGGRMPDSIVVVHSEAQNCGADIADEVKAGRIMPSDIHKYLPSISEDDDGDGVADSKKSMTDRNFRRLLKKGREKAELLPMAAELMQVVAELEQYEDNIMAAAPKRKR